MNNQQNLTKLDKIESKDNKEIDIVRPSETEPFAWDHMTSVLS